MNRRLITSALALICASVAVQVCEQSIAHAGNLTLQRWATDQGAFVGYNWVVGHFATPGWPAWPVRDDVADVWNDNGGIDIDVHESTGSSFVLSRWATGQGTYPDNVQWVSGDFNCDGYEDIADAFEVNGQIDIDVHYSTGESFGLERWATNQGSWIDGGVFVAGDFNGDFCSDIAYVFTSGGAINVDVHASTGDSFTLQRWANSALYGSMAGVWLAGDFDGDGTVDLADATGNDIKGDYPNIFVLHSTDHGFQAGSEWFASPGGGEPYAPLWAVGDFTGDKVADLVMVQNFQPNYSNLIDFTLWTSAKSYFTQMNDYSQGNEGRQGNFIWSPNTGEAMMAFIGGDFNGDGLSDIVTPWDLNNKIEIDVHLNH
jgi:hypothetical protein